MAFNSEEVVTKSQEFLNKIIPNNKDILTPLDLSCHVPFFPDTTQTLDALPLFLTPSILSERIDDIPLLTGILLKLDLPDIINKIYTPHANYKGLSPGWVLTVWLVYILSRSDHRMNRVQEWVAGRCSVLAAATGQEISDKDFTDDRLADILKLLSDDTFWSQLEKHIARHTIRAYDLSVEKIRLDATTASVNHDPAKHPLFQVGRTKQDSYNQQFKLMVGTLDPLGFPLATDVVSGEKADDPLYLPTYERIREILDKAGLLYIGDCKMGAIHTRAVIHNNGDRYLVPLAMIGDTPILLDKTLSELEAGKHEVSDIYLPEDLPENENEKPDPNLALAKGFEITVEREVLLDGEKIVWEERICCVQSFRYAGAQSESLEDRLAKAEEALRGLTPPPGPGKKQYQDEAELRIAADKILNRYKVNGLIDIIFIREESHKNIRAYGGKPARTETTVRYQVVDTPRNTEEIEQTKKRLGWRLYATNALAEELSLTETVLTYREQYIVERTFARFKGRRIGITPLYVQRDDHACGLIRLLTIALRAMCIIEFSANRTLLEEQDTLQGIYPGNPKRNTTTPSADLMLEAFNGLDFYVTDLPNGQHFEQVSPLNEVQKKILHLLDLPESIYNKLVKSPHYGLQMGSVGTHNFANEKCNCNLRL